MDDKNVLKPRRPFGVTLAIIFGVLFYSVIPLLQIGLLLRLEYLVRRAGDNSSPFGTQTISGGNFRGDISDERLIFQVVMALLFLVVAFFAWYGKPKFMRFVYMLAILALTGVTLVLSVLPDDGVGISGSSLDSFLACVQTGWLIVSAFLFPLYVIWYLNRAPARAFYRGYFLPEELAAAGIET